MDTVNDRHLTPVELVALVSGENPALDLPALERALVEGLIDEHCNQCEGCDDALEAMLGHVLGDGKAVPREDPERTVRQRELLAIATDVAVKLPADA